MNEIDRLISEGRLEEAEQLKINRPSISRGFARNEFGAKFQKIGGHEQDNHDGEDIQKHLDSIDREEMRMLEIINNEKSDPITALHYAAGRGLIDMVERVLNDNVGELINSADANGWQSLHEAVRANQFDVVKYLVDMGADIGAQTSGNDTPLSLARKYLDSDSSIIGYLVGIGAPERNES